MTSESRNHWILKQSSSQCTVSAIVDSLAVGLLGMNVQAEVVLVGIVAARRGELERRRQRGRRRVPMQVAVLVVAMMMMSTPTATAVTAAIAAAQAVVHAVMML